jgi:hypothetical protein
MHVLAWGLEPVNDVGGDVAVTGGLLRSTTAQFKPKRDTGKRTFARGSKNICIRFIPGAIAALQMPRQQSLPGACPCSLNYPAGEGGLTRFVPDFVFWSDQ